MNIRWISIHIFRATFASSPFDRLFDLFPIFADAIVAFRDDGPQRRRLYPRRGENQSPGRKDLRVQERAPVRHVQV
jgi:hypothetical protein